jgi:hypothetical protein
MPQNKNLTQIHCSGGGTGGYYGVIFEGKETVLMMDGTPIKLKAGTAKRRKGGGKESARFRPVVP